MNPSFGKVPIGFWISKSVHLSYTSLSPSSIKSVNERVLKDSERVLNHRGTSAESSHYERKVESVSTFSPKHPGKYVLHVVAEFETGEISQKDVEVFVEGDSIEDNNSGCSVIQGNSGTILLFYGILLLSIIRRFSNRIRGE